MTRRAHLFATLIALVSIAGLVLQFVTASLESPALAPSQTIWNLARYFTILTNALVAVSFTWMALRRRMAGALWLGGLTLWIAIVGVVYYALLANQLSGLDALADRLVHLVAPVLTVLFWLTCAPKHGLTLTSAASWLLWPLVYVVYALLRGQVDGAYPYFFVDPTRIGWDGVLRWSALLCVSFAGAGGLQVGIARLLR
ncbi:Pr6Pr family membrane protein [Salipiger bermudensis]|uniref:Pr6Pr family membrane protein n=1 Tax=Salipiger bermudensis TaxID=344736 RepID=UPI001C9940AE|nr:Pr6Pr family membrane protein [Salipiger bermudensis]MBY6002996.1 Pr6Pr family membrane protein [Salipiger bermudensis]